MIFASSLGLLPSGLLFSLVEHSRDKAEAWCDSSFTNAKEEAGGDQACKVLAGCMTHENSTP
jgi:hypothetical protein